MWMQGAVLVLFGLFLQGCTLMQFRGQIQRLDQRCRIEGVTPVGSAKNVSVSLLRLQAADASEGVVTAHLVYEKNGDWSFDTEPGQYAVLTVHNAQKNQWFKVGDIVSLPEETQSFECLSAGRKLSPPVYSITSPVNLSVEKIRPRGASEIVSLNDSRFSRKNAQDGLWRPYEFLKRNLFGIYFLEKHDPKKIPVLFIHGIAGTPADFSRIISQIDRTQFQPWIVFYPTGIALDEVAQRISDLLSEQILWFGVRRMAVVAHSAGATVSRAVLINLNDKVRGQPVKMLVTLSAPWGGIGLAGLGGRHMPVPIPSLVDLAPGSQFLHSLFYREEDGLDRRIRQSPQLHQLQIFAYLDIGAGDGRVSLASQLRREAQEEATRTLGVNAGHVGVLSHPWVMDAIVQELLLLSDS